MKITLVQLECLRCGHKWFPIGNEKGGKPRCCGFCKSPYWGIKPDAVSKTRKRHVQDCRTCKKP